MSLQNKRILLIIGGGIAAYKSLELIRRLRERGAAVRARHLLGSHRCRALHRVAGRFVCGGSWRGSGGDARDVVSGR